MANKKLFNQLDLLEGKEKVKKKTRKKKRSREVEPDMINIPGWIGMCWWSQRFHSDRRLPLPRSLSTGNSR